MSIFKSKNINSRYLIDKIANIVKLVNSDLSGGSYMKRQRELTNLSKDELNFVKAVSNGMTEDEVTQLKTKIKEDDSVIKNYRNRGFLKDAVSGKLLPKSSFAIDVNYPAREFRAITST